MPPHCFAKPRRLGTLTQLRGYRGDARGRSDAIPTHHGPVHRSPGNIPEHEPQPTSLYITANVEPQEIDNVLECVAKTAGIAKPRFMGGEMHVPSGDTDAFESALHSCDPERLIGPS